MSGRRIEAAFLAVMAVAVLVGGRALLVEIATFKGLAVAVLAIVAVLIVYAFRRNFAAGGPGVRLSAARDAAFLAAIVAAIWFVYAPARWSIGAAVVGLEIGIIIELVTRLAPVFEPSEAPQK